MRLVIQRVSEALVSIEGECVGSIGKGLMILVGVEDADTQDDVRWLSKKVSDMRIFADNEGKMNLSIKDVEGQALIVSQFTLHASTKKGNRPSFIKAAKPDHANHLYELFKEEMSQLLAGRIACGQFGADMQVALINDGPVTIVMDSQNRE